MIRLWYNKQLVEWRNLRKLFMYMYLKMCPLKAIHSQRRQKTGERKGGVYVQG